MSHAQPDAIDALLEIVACPDDHQALHRAPQALVDRLNAAVAQRGLRQRNGDLVDAPFDAALVTADRARAYPVRADLAELLVDTAILLNDDDRALYG